VRLTLSASELAGFDLFGAPSLKPMPDHWPMIPASVIASVGDRITLSVGADELKNLARPVVGEPGPAHSR
jgi:hypothetical protein